jgi:nitrogen regulatory protein PII
MKLVTAVIKPHALDRVRTALKHAGIEGMTITEVKGFGRQGGHTETYRGAEYKVDFVPKVKVEVLVDDEVAAATIETLVAAASSGTIGDGKLWVTEVHEVVRIRTGERGTDAI